MHRREFLARGGAALAANSIKPIAAFAQGVYPHQAIRVVVPRAAGGVVDVVARLWAEKVKPHLGSIVIEDQGGGGGLIAATTVARAQPDGYTLLAGTSTELVNSPIIVTNPPYDPLKDFAPITLIAASVAALMVHASLPVRTLPELVAYAKAHPGTLVYGSAGVGTTAHLCGELFKMLAGLPDIVHIPYRGGNPGLADFYAGHLPIFATAISPQAMAMQRNGTIRILVAATDHHLRAAPDVPIGAEVGFPELIAVLFMGLFAPAGTPQAIIDKIASATRDAMADPNFQAQLLDDGFEPFIDSGPEAAARFVQSEIARWRPVLKEIDLKLQ